MSYFFGNKDIQVSINKLKQFAFGTLNTSILVTDEGTIPPVILTGDAPTKKDKLQTTLDGLAITAPKLQNALDLALSQVDINGKSLEPEIIYVCGGTEGIADVIDSYITTEEASIYGIMTTFEDESVLSELIALANRRTMVISVPTLTTSAFLDTSMSDRVIGWYQEEPLADEFMNVAALSRFINRENTQFEMNTLTGITSVSMANGDVTLLEEAGKNTFRKVNKRNVMTGDRCSDGSSSFEATVRADKMRYYIAIAIFDLWYNKEKLSVTTQDLAIIKQRIEMAMRQGVNDGLVAPDVDGQKQYSVTMPTITSSMIISRVIGDIKVEYIPSVSATKVVIEGTEVTSITTGGDI